MSEYSSCSSVKLSSVGSSRIIEMNRPYSLNTLNLEMVACMTEAIKVTSNLMAVFNAILTIVLGIV